MTAHAPHRIAPCSEGQVVRPRAAFTWEEAVGYNVHHEGVSHVARCAAEAAAKARGPPAGTGEPRACQGLTININRPWCPYLESNHQSHQTKAVARRS